MTSVALRTLRSRRNTARLMLAPAILWMLALSIFPLVYSFYMAFTSYRLGGDARWVGVDNFDRMLSDDRLHEAVQFTAIFVGAAVSIELVLGFALALLLDTVTRGRGAVRTIWTLPLFATPVAIAYLSLTLFAESGGPVNSMLRGLGGEGVAWLSSESTARWTIVLLDVWQWTPFVVLILFAALQSIPPELVEAARVDGASAWRLIRHLIFPALVPAILTVLFLRVADAIKMFDFAFALTGGGPGTSTETASMYGYRQALENFSLGYGSAVAYGLFVLALLLGGGILVVLRRVQRDGGPA